ncbi:pleckstrin domain-containing protein [Heterostelium album PN500]|uniref:Pleckstrin domain-containing protein n=1 Tax=Heterostelium pallidum (strain ATCC 26659 / Pp 5 / PN500) TaxID=670386 RepID=D3BSV7_HETP5|nr:pleckstrin domain-containing protein [Heterostelium album PN500]EFA75572.1 pleckstrin domain-containing protein [Heterostelium album PN500]|eukprot:XP_020427706.1 pleckstrin domain-containing protein [Heterostelium album PN500]
MSYKYNGVPPPNFVAPPGVPMQPMQPMAMPMPMAGIPGFPVGMMMQAAVAVPAAPQQPSDFVAPHGVQLTYNPMTGEYKAYTQKTFFRTPSTTEVPIGKHVGSAGYPQFLGIDQVAQPYGDAPPGFLQAPYNNANLPPQMQRFNQQKFVPDTKSMAKPPPPSLYQPQPQPMQLPPQQFGEPFSNNKRSSYPPPNKSISQANKNSVYSTPAIPISAMVDDNNKYNNPYNNRGNFVSPQVPQQMKQQQPPPLQQQQQPPRQMSQQQPPIQKQQLSQEHTKSSVPIARMNRPPESKEEMEKRNRTRQKVLQELVSTEESYCDSLENLILVYKYPLERDPSIKLDPHIIKGIFSNVEQILVVSKDLLLELKRRVSLPANQQNIGEIYIQKAQEMRFYVEYINNFEHSMQELHKVEEKYPGFFKETQKNNKYSLDIQSLLIMPVQRIPRYELLLKNLVEKTSVDHYDYQNLVRALDSIRDINSYINENKGVCGNKDRVATIYETLKNCPKNLVSPNRRWIREGILDTTCSNKKYCGTFKVYLFNDLIILAKQPLFHKKSRRYEYLLEINLENSEFKPIPNHDTSFRFISDPEGKSPLILTFNTASSKSKQSWISDLEFYVCCLFTFEIFYIFVYQYRPGTVGIVFSNVVVCNLDKVQQEYPGVLGDTVILLTQKVEPHIEILVAVGQHQIPQSNGHVE